MKSKKFLRDFVHFPEVFSTQPTRFHNRLKVMFNNANTAYQDHVHSQSLQGRTIPLGREAPQRSDPNQDRKIQAYMGYSQTQTQHHRPPGMFL